MQTHSPRQRTNSRNCSLNKSLRGAPVCRARYSLALQTFPAYRRLMSAIESNWKNTLAAFGIAAAAAIVIATLLAVLIVPTELPLRQDSLGSTVERFCDPAKSPAYAMNYEQMLACRDLAAQHSMAASTASLVRLGWLSLFASLAGTAFIVWTVLVSIRSMELTRLTLEHQQIAVRNQLRPKLRRTPPGITVLDDGGWRVDIDLINAGALPAIRVQKRWACSIVPAGNGTCQLGDVELTPEDALGICPPDTTIGIYSEITPDQVKEVEAGRLCIQSVYFVTYDDELGGQYALYTGVEWKGPKLRYEEGFVGFKYPAAHGRTP